MKTSETAHTQSGNRLTAIYARFPKAYELFRRFRGLETDKCAFVNLPEARSGRWGEGLTAEKMAGCRWLKPLLVGQFEFVEWTPDGHLRHSRFVAFREDKKALEVRGKRSGD